MKLSFHGAARTVTGSKHIIHLDNGKKYLLDCGMFQGMGKDTDRLNREWGFSPSEITHLILSHAHIDHCGLIPKLVKDGFSGNIYCTPATKSLAALLLEDSAKIQENDVKFENKNRAAQGLAYLQPLYTSTDAFEALDYFVEKEYDDWHMIDDFIQVRFTDAGHIIGSAAVHVRITENGITKQISFSGDVGRYRDIILKSPQTFTQADYIIIESTYGDKLHDETYTTPDQLLQWILKACIQKKGKLIIPAFSVGRTQEILYALNQLSLENKLPDIDYYLDSPLSVDATEVLKEFSQYFNSSIQKVYQIDDDPFLFKGLIAVKSVEDSKKLNYKDGPLVIISASGMADAGRVKHHISNNVENSKNTILFSGYCEPKSLGGKLQDGRKEVNIFGTLHEVNAEIGSIRSMSAHGDYQDLLHFLSCQNPQNVQKIFLIHGEYEVQKTFKNHILQAGFQNIEIPEIHTVWELS